MTAPAKGFREIDIGDVERIGKKLGIKEIEELGEFVKTFHDFYTYAAVGSESNIPWQPLLDYSEECMEEFISKVGIDNFPGKNILHKAIKAAIALRETMYEQNEEDLTTSEMAEAAKEKLEQLEKEDNWAGTDGNDEYVEVEGDEDDGDGEDGEDREIPGGEKGGEHKEPRDDKKRVLKGAPLSDEHKGRINAIKMQLRSLNKIQFEATKKRVEGDTRSKWYTLTPEDVDLIEDDHMINPDWVGDLVNGELGVTQNFSYKKTKKDIILCVDLSGSMSDSYKMNYVSGIFELFKDQVKRGDIKLWVARFECQVDDIQYVPDVDDYLKTFPEPYGGDTHIDVAIKQIDSWIETGELCGQKLGPERPHIVIINDGQDEFAPFNPQGVIHTIVLGRSNDDLENLSKSTGGLYIEL